jgi:hypothetical protein
MRFKYKQRHHHLLNYTVLEIIFTIRPGLPVSFRPGGGKSLSITLSQTSGAEKFSTGKKQQWKICGIYAEKTAHQARHMRDLSAKAARNKWKTGGK